MDDPIAEALGHVVYASVLVGQYRIMRGHRAGWLWRAFGEATMILLAYRVGVWSVMGWEAVFVGLSLWGWWVWGRVRGR